MGAIRLGLRGGRGWAVACLASWLCVAVTAACAGDAGPTPAGSTSDSAAVGESLRATDWVVTLIDAPQLRERVGEMGWQDTVYGEGEWIPEGAGEAEGMWLICSVELTNDGEEMRMLSGKLLKVTDAQGREFPMTGQSAHFIQIWSTEGYAVPDNQILQNPIDAGVTLEGPIIFDVAEDSTGLRLTADGIEESIDLGF